MRIQFLGAARQVTGSRTLLEAAGRRLLIDYGLFQERAFLERNWDPLPEPPGEFDALLLTHAHLDHCGLIPRLVDQGFGGPIYCTRATAELARIVLLDSAHIQEEDAAYKKKRHAREGRQGPHPEVPLYTVAQTEAALARFEPVDYDDDVELGPRLAARFREAGHILGSALIEIDAGVDGGGRRRLVFSGDLGQWRKPLVNDPEVVAEADTVVMESTYGDRDHEDPGTVEDLLAGIINETVERGGNIVIPVFAVERAQEVLYVLSRLVCEKRIPRVLTVLDSPMAVEVTDVFRRYRGQLDEEAKGRFRAGCAPFDFPGLKLFRTPDESKTVNRIRGSCIILAGSGMATAGRIKHHLAYNIGRPESTILFVGYQAQQTLGRQILDGKPEVRIAGVFYPVRARVAQIQGFSGHAGRSDLLRWLRGFRRPPRRLFLTHGEEAAALDLAAVIKRDLGWTAVVPETGASFDLE